jgi:hypothetical protein
MKVKAFTLIPIVAGLLLPAAALAQAVSPRADSPGASAAIIDRLQKQEQIDEYKAKFWSQEPITQQDYYVQAREDRHLINRISAGYPVSHDELAQALKRVDTDY